MADQTTTLFGMYVADDGRLPSKTRKPQQPKKDLIQIRRPKQYGFYRTCCSKPEKANDGSERWLFDGLLIDGCGRQTHVLYFSDERTQIKC